MGICKCNYRDIKTLPSSENQSVNLQNNSIDLLQKDDDFPVSVLSDEIEMSSVNLFIDVLPLFTHLDSNL